MNPGTETNPGTGPIAVEAVDKNPWTLKHPQNPIRGPLSIRHLATTGFLESADLQGTGRSENVENNMFFEP